MLVVVEHQFMLLLVQQVMVLVEMVVAEMVVMLIMV